MSSERFYFSFKIDFQSLTKKEYFPFQKMNGSNQQKHITSSRDNMKSKTGLNIWQNSLEKGHRSAKILWEKQTK